MWAARNGHAGAARALLLWGNAGIALRSSDGATALTLAREHGQRGVARTIRRHELLECCLGLRALDMPVLVVLTVFGALVSAEDASQSARLRDDVPLLRLAEMWYVVLFLLFCFCCLFSLLFCFLCCFVALFFYLLLLFCFSFLFFFCLFV